MRPLVRIAGAASAAALVAAAAAAAAAACSAGGAGDATDAGAVPGLADGATANDASDAGPATLAVQMGTGSAFFAPLDDGADVILVRGKQGYQHVWISARVLEPSVHDAVVTISSVRQDGRWSGPDVSAAVALEPVDGGDGGAVEKVGMTALLDYGAIGKAVFVRVEVVTADGLHGADERLIHVLPPNQFACTVDAGTTSCAELCGALVCSPCETGSAVVGYLSETDASAPPVESCSAPLVVDAPRAYACCCCR